MTEIIETVLNRLSVLTSQIGVNILAYHKLLVDQVGEKLAGLVAWTVTVLECGVGRSLRNARAP